MKKVEIGNNFSVTVPDFSHNQEYDCKNYWVRPMDIKISGSDNISECLLASKETEQQYPELTLAGAMLLRHPIVQTEGLFWGQGELIENARQGVFILTDKETGEKIQYAVRQATRENGDVIVLWGMGYSCGSQFGYFETERTEGEEYCRRVTEDTYVTHMEHFDRLKKNPELPKVIVEKMDIDLGRNESSNWMEEMEDDDDPRNE